VATGMPEVGTGTRDKGGDVASGIRITDGDDHPAVCALVRIDAEQEGWFAADGVVEVLVDLFETRELLVNVGDLGVEIRTRRLAGLMRVTHVRHVISLLHQPRPLRLKLRPVTGEDDAVCAVAVNRRYPVQPADHVGMGGDGVGALFGREAVPPGADVLGRAASLGFDFAAGNVGRWTVEQRVVWSGRVGDEDAGRGFVGTAGLAADGGQVLAEAVLVEGARRCVAESGGFGRRWRGDLAGVAV